MTTNVTSRLLLRVLLLSGTCLSSSAYAAPPGDFICSGTGTAGSDGGSTITTSNVGAYGNTVCGVDNSVNVTKPPGQGDSAALGSSNTVVGLGGSTAMGVGNTASGFHSTAIGTYNFANSEDSVAIGWDNNDSVTAGVKSTAVGTYNKATGLRSVALGTGNTASATDSVAIGSGANTNIENSVAIGANSVGAAVDNVSAKSVYTGSVVAGSVADGTVSVGGGTAGYTVRQIKNVAAGAVSSSSTDAVNGSQLYALGQSVNGAAGGAASGLGGGAAWNASTGTWTAPTYTINSTNYNNVGDALAAVNTSTDNLGTTTAQRLGGGSVYVPGTGVTAPSYNIQGTTFNNVGDAFGAVNNNLTGLNNGVAFLGASMNALGQQQRNQQGEYRQGIAIATAMPTAHFPSAPGKTTVTVASGAYKGYGAIGGAIMHRLNAPFPLAIGATIGTGYRNSVAGRAEIVSEF